MARTWKQTAWAVVLVAASLTPTPAQAQDVILSIRSFDALLADVKHLLKLMGLEDRAQQLEGLLALAGGGQEIRGLDSKKPMGLYIPQYAKEGADTPLVVFLPVTKQEDLLEVLRGFGLEPGKPQDGIYTMDTPLGVPAHLRFANQYVFIAMEADLLKGNLPEPSKFLPAAHQKNLIALTARVDKIPAEAKRNLVEEMEASLKADAEKREDETEEQHQLRVAISKAMADVIVMFLEDGKDLTASINVDREGGSFIAEMTATSKPGSPLAGRIKEFGPGGATAPVHFEIAVGKVLQLFAPQDPKQREALQKLLGEDKAAKDTVKLTVSGGDAIRLRLEIGGPGLRVLGVLIQAGMPTEG